MRRKPGVLRFRGLRRRQVPPRERPVLTIGLAERDGEPGLRELSAQVERMRGFVHAKLREDVAERRRVRAAYEAIVVEHGDSITIREDAKVRIGDAGLQRAQLFFRVSQDGGVFYGHEAVVHALRDGVLRDRVVHEAPGHVHLAHRAPRPWNHFRGQHRTDAQLLADGDEHGVHARGIGRGELGEVADAHQHPGFRVAPPRFGVALDRRGEPVADRLENRIDEIRDPAPGQRVEGRLQRVERSAELGHGDDARACPSEIARDLDVRAVDAEDELGARLDGRSNLPGIERVDADAPARLDQLGDDVAERGEGEPGCAADVDDVGAGRVEVVSRAADVFARQLRCVVDLSGDLDVPRAVAVRRRGPAKMYRQLAEIARSFFDAQAQGLANQPRVALAQPRNHHEVGAVRHVGL